MTIIYTKKILTISIRTNVFFRLSRSPRETLCRRENDVIHNNIYYAYMSVRSYTYKTIFVYMYIITLYTRWAIEWHCKTRGRKLLKTRSREYKSIVSRGLSRAHKRTHAPDTGCRRWCAFITVSFSFFFTYPRDVPWRGVDNKSPVLRASSVSRPRPVVKQLVSRRATH